MKRYNFILLALMVFLYSCKPTPINPPTPKNPIDELPPYSQKGANKFGCLVNGEVFKPRTTGGIGNIPLRCFNQYIDGTYHFSLAATNFYERKAMSFNSINDTAILKTGIISLSNVYSGDMGASFFIGFSNYKEYNNYPPAITGELDIKYFDPDKGIVSGTFWYDAVDTVNNDTIQVREGRFDVQFTN